MNGKSYSFQIWLVHSEGPSEQKPVKFLEKRERGRIHGLPKFFGYPLLSKEREKLRISNLASTFRGSIRIKAHEKFWRKREAWAYPGTAQFFRVPPIISGMAKAEIFKFCTHIYRLNRNKRSLKILGKVAVGIVWDSRKFSGHPYIWRIARSSLR